MANLKDLADSRGTLLNYAPSRIKIKDGLNARDLTTPEARAHIDYLKASIKESGFMASKPLEIFLEGDEVFVSDGHCRLTAVHELEAEGFPITTVPCIPEGKGVNDVDRFLRQNTSNSGLRLTMVEEGYNVKRAINLGLTATEVAKRLGKSQSFIAQLLEFQAAPAEVHAMVKDGKVSSTFAAETMRERPQDGKEILKAAIAKAQEEGKDKATKKHSVLHQPKAVSAAPAPAKVTVAGVSKEEIKVALSLAAAALTEAGIEPELSERLDRLSKAKW